MWYTMVSREVLTRDRLFRHGRLLAQDAQEGRCVMPGCMEEVPETLTHRFWTCAAHEHFRSSNFRAIRDTTELRHPCELMCGIVLNFFPLHFDTVDMQRCMVAIELNARRLLDERRATRDDPLAHQREIGTCHSHRKKRPRGVGPKMEWQAPETTHAVQHLVFSQDGARVQCSRCTRVASKSRSGQWQAFWKAECVEVREDQNLGKLRVRAVTGLVLELKRCGTW